MRWLAPAAGAAAVVGTGLAAWPYTVDDAFVSARYARRIARGLGYTFVDGPPTDGVTGPLGLVPGLLGELLAGDPILGAKAAGLAAAAAAAAWAVHRAARAAPAEGWVAAGLIALWPLLGIWAVAGLETGLATLACTAVGLGVVNATGESPGRGDLWVGAGTAALAWLRPEAAPACLVALALVTRSRGRASAPALALAAAGALGVLAFRLAMFGSPLPLSASAKPPDLAHGLEYTARAGLVVLGVLGALPAFLAAREPGPRRALVAVLVAHVAAVILAGGDWMPGFRLFVPWLPALAFTMAAPIASPDRRRWIGVALFVGAAAVPALAGGLALVNARDAGATRARDGRALASWLEGRYERVAMVDVGYVPYTAELDVVDLGGITDPTIGRLPGGHVDKAIDPGALLDREPDAIVLGSRAPPRVDDQGRLRGFWGHPVEHRVAQMGWVRAQLRVVRVQRYGPERHYVVLARRPSGR